MRKLCILIGLIIPLAALEKTMLSPHDPYTLKARANLTNSNLGDASPSNLNEPWASLVITECINNDSIVCDVGAHYGAWSSLVRSCWPTAQIYATDPLLAAQEQLMTRFAGDVHLTVIPCAIVNGNGPILFYEYPEHESICSSVYRRYHLEQLFHLQPREYIVQALTLDGLCAGYHLDTIDYLKISAGGAELDVLISAQHKLVEHKIKYVQFEYGPSYRDSGHQLAQIAWLLSQFGYVLFKITNTKLVHLERWDYTYENYEQSYWLAIASSELTRENVPEYKPCLFLPGSSCPAK